MRKLLAPGITAMLFCVFILASGCHKKDIDKLNDRVDALEERVKNNEEALEALRRTTLTGQVVRDITVADGELTLTVAYSSGDPKTIVIPYTEPVFEQKPVQIVKKQADGRFFRETDEYYEFEVYNDSGKDAGTTVFRIGKHVSLEQGFGVRFITTRVEGVIGGKAVALVQMNPADFKLTKDNIAFAYAGLVPVGSRAEPSGLAAGITVNSVTRATDLTAEKWAQISERDQLEGTWVIEFYYGVSVADLEAKTTPSYELVVSYPLDAADYNAVYAGGSAAPAVPAVKKTSTVSFNALSFVDKVYKVVDGMLSVDPAAGSVNSDGSYPGALSVDAALYGVDPEENLTAARVTGNSLTVRVERGGQAVALTEDDREALLEIIHIALSAPTGGGTHAKYRNFTVTFGAEELWPGAVKVGDKVIYSFSFSVDDHVGGTVESDAFTLTVNKVTNIFDLSGLMANVYQEFAPFYIPAVGHGIGSRSIASPSGVLYLGLRGLGFTDAEIAAASFTALTVQRRAEHDGAQVWEASAAPISVTPGTATTPYWINVGNTIDAGTYRIYYNFNVGGRSVRLYERVRVVAPLATISLRENSTLLPVTSGNVVYDPTGASGARVMAASLVLAGTGPVSLAHILDVGAVTLSHAQGMSGVLPDYQYASGNGMLGNNSAGIMATPESVAVRIGDDMGKAEHITLSVRLSTGQTLPLRVRTYGASGYVPGDWTDGNFYVAANGDNISAVYVDMPIVMADYAHAQTSPVDVTDRLERMMFRNPGQQVPQPAPALPVMITAGSTTITVGGHTDVVRDASVYELACKDRRVESVVFRAGDITMTNNATVPEGASLFTTETGEKDFEITDPDNPLGRVTVKVPAVYLRTVQNDGIVWSQGSWVEQELIIEVTDVFGATKRAVKTVRIRKT